MGPSLHPLLIDLILGTVFQFCDFEQLKDCRLVCKTWYKISIPEWLDKGPYIKLKKQNAFVAFLETLFHGTENGFHCSSLCTGIQTYKKFSLSQLGSFPYATVEAFWNMCGRWMTQLEVKHCTSNLKLEDYKNIMFCKFTPQLEVLSVLKEYPRLKTDVEEGQAYDLSERCETDKLEKTLSMRSISVSFLEGAIWGRRFGISWTQFLSHYPNLQKLSIGNCGSNREVELDRVLNAIAKIHRRRDQYELSIVDSPDLIQLTLQLQYTPAKINA